MKLSIYLLVVATLVSSVIITGCNKHSIEASEGKHKPSTPASSISVAAAPKSHDGPLGISMGVPLTEVKNDMGFKPLGSSQGVYEGTPPKTVDGAKSYMVLATEQSGVCRILVTFGVPVVNGSGDQVKELVDRLGEMLKIKYGDVFRKIDYSSQDVYVRNPQYWMMGLAEDSVGYAHSAKGTDSHPLPFELRSVEVAANATSSSSAYATVSYTFKNFDACTKDLKTAKSQNL